MTGISAHLLRLASASRWPRRRSRLACDQRGSTLPEFAMIAPVMILLITGTVEAAHYLMVQTTLESAVSMAARENAVAAALDEDTRDEILRDRITSIMGSYPAAYTGAMTIETKVYRSFDAAIAEPFEDLNGNGIYDEDEPFVDRNGDDLYSEEQSVAGTMGGVGDVVSYDVVYPVKPFFAFLAPIFGETIDITSSTVAKNEPEKSALSGYD